MSLVGPHACRSHTHYTGSKLPVLLLESATYAEGLGIRSVTRDGLLKTMPSTFFYWTSSLLSDGSRVYFMERTGARRGIARVSSTAGGFSVSVNTFTALKMRN